MFPLLMMFFKLVLVPLVSKKSRLRATTIRGSEWYFVMCVGSSVVYMFLSFRLVDVGGQRNERKKWIHCFEDVTAIIFFADASAYNLTLFEDDRVNRLLEALTLFEEICNCKYFHTTPLILFLNKRDLLKKKIEEVDIADYFDDYEGWLRVLISWRFFK